MKKVVTTGISGIISLGIFGALYLFYFLTHGSDIAKQQQLSALLSGNTAQAVLGVSTKSFGCQVHDGLPDSQCTPGAIFANATKDTICVSGYSKTVRNVSISLKKDVYQEYGIVYPEPHGSYEVDHLIPLALGGSNDKANLWPEAADPMPGFREKDVVENYLHEAVCNGEVSLGVAQQKIANNWLEIYNNLSPSTIQDLKNRYRNWTNN